MNKPLNADKKQRAYILYIMEAGAKKPGNISISIFCQHKSTNRNNPYKNIPTKKKVISCKAKFQKPSKLCGDTTANLGHSLSKASLA